MMLGIAPEKISKLMEIARATARMTGQEVSTAFDNIAMAVGRQSKMILDNLGIIVSVESANRTYAVQLKSKQQIFFLTKADIVKMMSMVEIRIPIEYTLMGAFKQETIRRENTISNFSKLGHTGYANWISLDNRYMVLPLNNEVKYRIVKQRNGSFHFGLS